MYNKGKKDFDTLKQFVSKQRKTERIVRQRDRETEIHRDRGTEGQRNRGTEGQRDRGTEGQRDRRTEGQRDRRTEEQNNSLLFSLIF